MDNLKELKMTNKIKREVIMDSVNNLSYLEIRELLKKLLDASNTNKNIAYTHLAEKHKGVLIDSLYLNEVLEEE